MTLRLDRRRGLRMWLTAGLAALMAFAKPGAAVAQEGGIRTIRDTETEQLLRDYARPILQAAGLSAGGGVEIVIVQDRAFNAFVMDGRRIFITLGVLFDSVRPNETIGVLAHEAGHIAGGHLARLREQMQAAQTTSIIAMLVGMAGAIAGASMRGSGGGDVAGAAGGLAMGAQDLNARTFLAYARAEEQAADRAAVNFLNATRQSPRGMVDTFARMSDAMIMTARMADPYMQSHPLPADRLQTLRQALATSPHRDAVDPPALIQRHRMMQAKISGFTERTDQVLRRYPVSDRSLAARYARAIASYRTGGGTDAIAAIDGLISEQPNNPFFHELKGQALLETGNPRAAIASYRRALQLSPNAPLIRAGLGRALVSAGDNNLMDEAVRELERALTADNEIPFAHRMLAIAYGRRGDNGRAQLAIARGYMVEGNLTAAQGAARRAQAALPNGSPAWLRADDIINARRERRS
jgi:predicted Zn-dependent protease